MATKFWYGLQPILPSVPHLVEPLREKRLLTLFFPVCISTVGSSTETVSPYTHAKNSIKLNLHKPHKIQFMCTPKNRYFIYRCT